MDNTYVIIMAAGKGTRMRSNDLPKVLMPLNGRPLLDYLLDSIKHSGIDTKPVIVVGHQAEMIKEHLGSGYVYVHQEQQLGSGHAVGACKAYLRDRAEHVLVLNGDHPLYSSNTIDTLTNHHLQANPTLTIGTVNVPDFQDWRQEFYHYGRIVRDEQEKIKYNVEFKDCTEPQTQITEVNVNCFCFNSKWLWEHVDQIENDNAAGEYYLPDLLGMAIDQQRTINSFHLPATEASGVNTPEQLALLEKLLSNRTVEHM